MKFFILFIILALPIFYCMGQDITQDQLEQGAVDIESQTEQLSQEEQFQELKKQPIDLNKATLVQLQQSGLFSQKQASSIIDLRERNNGLVSIDELSTIVYFDSLTIVRIKEYCIVKSNNEISTNDHHSTWHLFSLSRAKHTLEREVGYEQHATNPYLGKDIYWLQRVKISKGNKFQIGLTTEKDAGEIRKPDFLSSFVKIQHRNTLITLGDYQVTWGQGLVLWTGFGFRKTSLVTSVNRQANGVKPSVSTNEHRFFRGAAIEHVYKNWMFTCIASSNRIDATSQDSLHYFTSLQTTGFHRSENELKYRKNVHMHAIGGRIQFTRKMIHLGIHSSLIHFNKQYLPRIAEYNYILPFQKRYLSSGIDYQLQLGTVHLFGEYALGENLQVAQIHGLEYRTSKYTEIVCAIRNYSPGYQAWFHHAFAEQSTPRNEYGAYIGISWSPIQGINWSNYIDVYASKQPSFDFPAPFNGIDWLSQATFYTKNNSIIILRSKIEQKNILEEQTFKTSRTSRHRFQIQLQPSNNWIHTSRIEITSSNKNIGSLLYHDIIYSKYRYKIGGRFAIMNVPSYDLAIYAYEQDVRYSYSVPAYAYNGARIYLVTKIPVVSKVSIWIKIGRWIYSNRESIGSGSELIHHNHETSLTFQAIFDL